jgi:hypothetical protein
MKDEEIRALRAGVFSFLERPKATSLHPSSFRLHPCPSRAVLLDPLFPRAEDFLLGAPWAHLEDE